MDNRKLLDILREEYGIKTLRELNRAIAEQNLIDLSPFCGVAIKQKEVKENLV